MIRATERTETARTSSSRELEVVPMESKSVFVPVFVLGYNMKI